MVRIVSECSGGFSQLLVTQAFQQLGSHEQLLVLSWPCTTQSKLACDSRMGSSGIFMLACRLWTHFTHMYIHKHFRNVNCLEPSQLQFYSLPGTLQLRMNRKNSFIHDAWTDVLDSNIAMSTFSRKCYPPSHSLLAGYSSEKGGICFQPALDIMRFVMLFLSEFSHLSRRPVGAEAQSRNC